jgi:hypothetical protein
MNIRNFSGEDAISELCTCSMAATVQAMVTEGFISQEDADAFVGKHIAVLSSTEGVWSRVRKFLGWNDNAAIVILEVK